MGEWMTQVPVKLSPETVARLDLLRAAYPFKPGRSTVIRELVEEGLRLIAEGILQFRATTSNRVPSVLSVPGIPEDFSVVPNAQKKPLVRVSPSKSGSHQRREFRSLSQRRAVGVVGLWARGTSFPLKSTRVSWRPA